ncbi:glycoside hydrolase family 9 protein [Streptomyces lushanensis]|uniref:glycoside hydrolase family 9 protein n=1 Tax=Streptomyces lushanensis TaxID=1434255 RepID=UPI00082A91CF|nr:glycoside hydrolase family 9 protein [Streptomyces lushanensis]
MAANDNDLMIAVDFNPLGGSEYIRPLLQKIVDSTRADQQSGLLLSESIDRQHTKNGIGYYQSPASGEFDGSISVQGDSLIFVIPVADIGTAGFWDGLWKKLVAGTAGFAASVVSGGACLYVVRAATGALIVCGAVAGAVGGGVSELVGAVLDGKSLDDAEVWGQALGTAITGAVSGASLGVLMEFVSSGTTAMVLGIRTSLWNFSSKLFGNPLQRVGELFDEYVARIIRETIERLVHGIRGSGVCRERNADPNQQDWAALGSLTDRLRALLDRLEGGSENPGTGEPDNPGTGQPDHPGTGGGPENPGVTEASGLRFPDLDGDGDADRALVMPDGKADLAQNDGCDAAGARLWKSDERLGPVPPTGIDAGNQLFGDLDGDDRDDYIAILDAEHSPSRTATAQVWRNTSDTDRIQWEQPRAMAAEMAAPATGRAFVDLDGDGDDDYVTMDERNTVTAWENTARGFPSPADWSRIPGFGHPGEGQETKALFLADVTADGRTDLLLLDRVTGGLTAWANTGGPWTRTSGWEALGTISSGDPLAGHDPGAVSFGDLDGDRVADLLLFDRTERRTSAWLLPHYGSGSQEDPGQPPHPGNPLELPPGTLPAYSGGRPQPQVDGRLLQNSNFTGTDKPWWVNAGMTPRLKDGVYCVTAPASTNPWDVLVGHNSIYLPGGRSYTLRFRARTSGAANPLVQIAPFYNPTNVTYLSKGFTTSGTWKQYEYTFTTNYSDPYVLSQLQFRLGRSAAPYEFCMDDVTLNGDEYVPRADAGPAVKANQFGYLPNGPKRATVLTTATGPVDWELRRVGGGTVATGRTTPAGFDGSAGSPVHTVDFSQVSATGRFHLVVGGEASHPFDIRADLYASLRTDSMRFFYTNRSGTAIDGGVAGAAYARPAGHVASSPDGGDSKVPCQAPKPYVGNWTCDYTLDVTGGWYDAGDHGKYVVNGGIATHQLLSEWERAVEQGSQAQLGDSTLAVPERGNGVPDILDEARWNLEFMLKMQVPAGKPQSGMVHHKVHDESWTGPPMLPHQDKKKRELHRPSTAATLDLAAVAAQGARLYAPYDPAFAGRLRAAAERAYTAARANPTLYAPADDRIGGGPYSDTDVSDEFYWAAAELYLTTKNGGYLTDVRSSRFHAAGQAFSQNGFYWGSVAALGQLDLARLGDGLTELPQIRNWLKVAADTLISFQRAERFGQTYTPSTGKYDWGSNASMLNNQVVLATAYDITGDRKYADAVFEGLDYLLGRNALGQSYITSYGTNDAKNQHSRWYAKSFDATLPNPPAGTIAGGPNSSLQDPLAATWLHGCAPQLCYVDNLEAWSLNEITINWNSALAWVSAFAADVAGRR